MQQDVWRQAIIKVGDGRGFVVESNRGRYVITAAHCLPELPPAHLGAYPEQRTYAYLLGRIGQQPNMWAECLFADPVADLAVVGAPDGQELSKEAEAYDELIEQAAALPIGSLTFVRKRHTLRDGSSFDGWPTAESDAWMLSLEGEWFTCRVSSTGRSRRSLWVADAAEPLRPGMSGSPIMSPDGAAIGIFCISSGGMEHREGGPNPLLASSLPAWLISEWLISKWSPKKQRTLRDNPG